MEDCNGHLSLGLGGWATLQILSTTTPTTYTPIALDALSENNNDTLQGKYILLEVITKVFSVIN